MKDSLSKITEVALKATFKLEDTQIAALLSVVNATNNSVRATEVLLGLEEIPEISAMPCEKYLTRNSGEQIITFVSYDYIQDKVVYEYANKNRTYNWFLRKGKEEGIQFSSKSYYLSEDELASVGLTQKVINDEYFNKEVYAELSAKELIIANRNTNNCSLSQWTGK